MDIYNMTGSIFIEGTMEQADYDFDMEWEGDEPPTDMDALRFMMDAGIIQIMHEDTEFVGTDNEEDEDE
jgi:hypothetical protein